MTLSQTPYSQVLAVKACFEGKGSSRTSVKAFVPYAMTLNIEKMRQRRHKLEFRTRFYVKNNAKVDLGRP